MKLKEKIISRINNIWLGYSDKILHFLFGYFIASQFQVTGYYMIIPAIVAGTVKEYYDIKQDDLKLNAHNLLNADWACTVGGGFYAFFVYGLSAMGGIHLPGLI